MLIAIGVLSETFETVWGEHRHWCNRQRPKPFAAAVRAAKAAVDPTGALNPGVLIDP